MTQEYAPAPWTYCEDRSEKLHIQAHDGSFVADMIHEYSAPALENAQRIVRCVNAHDAHDELVAALKGALVLLERLAPDTDRKLVGGSECSIGHYASYHVDVIRAALANLS